MTGSRFTIDGAIKVHNGGSSTAFSSIPRDSHSLNILRFTSGTLVAAIAMNAPSRSPAWYFRSSHSTSPSDNAFLIPGVASGLIIVICAPDWRSALIFPSAIVPPPNITQRLPDKLSYSG